MPETIIPPVPPDDPPGGSTRRREELEFELLEAEAKLKRLAHREIGQRYWLRWIAVGIGITVVAGMAATLAHLVHQSFWGPFSRGSSAFAVAMIVAPIASITAITAAVFVGAFKKFDDKDMETIGSGLAASVNIVRGGQ
ncbi:hypothetical protein [Tabrizicola sp.]|uniref:hypothetical protein n=1 Tax=Tabrizicola sp. TaxID=2005166 RepID=UPI00286BC506|nr:hypothetical protein [Tabrizicola sp.]